jgi:hypothetical protein
MSIKDDYGELTGLRFLRFNMAMDDEVNPTEPRKRQIPNWVLGVLNWALRFVLGAPGGLVSDYLMKQLGPPPAPLAVRAQEVSNALSKAGELLDELQADVLARTALIDSLAAKTQDAERRADEALTRADLSESEAKAVDAFLDRALKLRLAEVERNARRREWGIGTLVALIVGVGSILIAHFAFGF